MILKKLASALIVMLMCVNFFAYTEEDSHVTRIISGDLILNNETKPDCINQNQDSKLIRQEIKKTFLNFLSTVFSESEDTIKLFQENYIKNSEEKASLCSEKSCGCWMEIFKNYDSLKGYLCNKHIQLLSSQIPESYLTDSMLDYWIEIIHRNRFHLINSLLTPEPSLNQPEISNESVIQGNYTDDDLDNSIFAGMLADVRSLRLEDTCEFRFQEA